jgi:hypothetical protein
MRRFGIAALLGAALALGAAPYAPAAAQSALPTDTAAPRELLNSERIEQRFGSYGLAVLASDAHVRVSNLYSTDARAGTQTTRTFAVVRYPDAIDVALAREHAEILRGGSIGAVLTAGGWRVLKRHLGYDEIDAPARLATLMHVPPQTKLARHAYVLDVEKDGRVLPYAALVEIHHPDYLHAADLRAIYGPPSAQGREALLASLLATAAVEAAH